MKYSKNRKIYIAFSALSVIAIMAIIFYLSSQNGEESTNTSNWLTDLIISIVGKAPDPHILRTLAHFCEFAGLGFLINNLIFSIKDKLKPFIGVLLSWGYAWTDEIHQIFVPERAFQLFDLTVDLGGVILGTAVFSGIILLIKKHKRTH